jgi:hypothetical protein
MGMENGLSVADALALDKSDGEFGGNGAWMMMFLFFLLAWGGNGFGGWGNGNAAQGALTRGELCQDMNFQSLENAVRGVQSGLCDGFYAMNTGMLNGFYGVNNAIQQAQFAAQQCCCETNRNIDAVRYENAKNTCDIVSAIKADGDATRAMMTQNEMQSLRDQLQTANFQLSQQAQNATLINAIRPTPVPAYVTCSPYESNMYASGCYRNVNGCGC